VRLVLTVDAQGAGHLPSPPGRHSPALSSYVYAVRLDLWEPVFLKADSAAVLNAVVWSRSRSIIVLSILHQDFLDKFLQDVGTLTGEFTADYLAANKR
jgi:hypothetical protein